MCLVGDFGLYFEIKGLIRRWGQVPAPLTRIYPPCRVRSLRLQPALSGNQGEFA